MLTIQREKGNLIHLIKEKKIDVAAHGCNCFHRMGRGIAPLLNELSNGALLEADKQTPYADINKMGTASHALALDTMVFNVYTQYVYHSPLPGHHVYVHWDSVYNGLKSVINYAFLHESSTVGIPLIGCGLAHGTLEDFNRVLSKLEELYENKKHSLTLKVIELPT